MSVGRTPSTVNLAYNRFCTVCLNLQMKGVLGIAVLNIRNEIVFHQKYDISGLDAPRRLLTTPGKDLMRLQGKTPIACTSVWGWLFQESLIWLPRHL